MREELPVPVTLERVRRHLVGLRIPRALEVLDHTMCQIKRGEWTFPGGVESAQVRS